MPQRRRSSRTGCKILTVKDTGESFFLYWKRAWNNYYYSADGGATWLGTKADAYRAAKVAGTLNIAGADTPADS